MVDVGGVAGVGVLDHLGVDVVIEVGVADLVAVVAFNQERAAELDDFVSHLLDRRQGFVARVDVVLRVESEVLVDADEAVGLVDPIARVDGGAINVVVVALEHHAARRDVLAVHLGADDCHRLDRALGFVGAVGDEIDGRQRGVAVTEPNHEIEVGVADHRLRDAEGLAGRERAGVVRVDVGDKLRRALLERTARGRLGPCVGNASVEGGHERVGGGDLLAALWIDR